jgi:GTPase SAR1 family protein
MASSSLRRIAETKERKEVNVKRSRGKGKTRAATIHKQPPCELTEEERIEQELQKLYSTSFLHSASFYYGLPNGNIVRLNCYELGTEEYMIDAAVQQLRNSNAIVFGFDVTSAESFTYFDFLVPKMKQLVQPSCTLLMVANKCDLDYSTWCSWAANEKSELNKFTVKLGIEKYFLTSARYGTGVDTFIDYLANSVGIKRVNRSSDNSVDECKGCSLEFKLLKRKHHCRYCGGAFCTECTTDRMDIPDMNITKPVRVCGECKEVLEENRQRREQPLWDLLDLT